QQFRGLQRQIWTLLAAGSFIFLLGLADDLRPLRARHKFIVQVMAALALCIAGVRIESINVANLFTVNFGVFSYPVTIFWIVAITNAVNLIDGLDGLAAGICAIACGSIAVFAVRSGSVVMVVLMLAILGSLSGFLFFNFNPARIFLGDCGSMFLGFILAASSVMCAAKTNAMVSLALPALAFGLPIFDTVFSMLRRHLARWPIMSPDRGHLHHRLLDMGLRHRDVVILMYGITALATGAGLFMMVTHGGGTIAVFLCVLLLLILVFHAFGAVRLREIAARVRYNKELSQIASDDIAIFKNTRLELAGTISFKQWWKAVSEAAEKVNFARLTVTITTGNQRYHTFTWKSSNAADMERLLMVDVPVDTGRARPDIRIEARMNADGSLESCGRRLMLFGRLIDEYRFSQQERNENSTVRIIKGDIKEVQKVKIKEGKYKLPLVTS
ncbi:MAG: MraY family glycosyltransferase, partial [Phycisphaerae bacterium]|nr:MraY family glycosyltransferase [Phycisphaerae bacterium]